MTADPGDLGDARTLQDPLAESLRIVELADGAGLLVRLMGGMAIRAHAPDWPARTRRVEVDLDFATRSQGPGGFYELLAGEGYTADKRHNALFGGKQAYFVDVPRNRPVDVLVDSLEMCHRFEFEDRLAASTPTLPLAELLLSKLQVVKINRKDVLDALVLLAEHPLAQDDGARRADRAGRDQRPAHPVVHLERLGLVADRHRQPRHARPVPRGRADARGPRSRQRAVVLFDPATQVAALRDGHRRRAEVDALEASRAGRRAADLVPRARGDGTQLMRVFFATDIHGSDVCWRKFLNAGKFHKADVLIMGGDMTGKAMVPIVANGSSWELELQGQRHVLTTEDELEAMEKRISDRGYYPVRLTRDEVDAWSADPTLVDTRFKAEMLASVERWMALGDERLAGTGIRCIVSPANDDMFEIDPIIERPSISSSARRTRSSSTASRWSRPAGPTRRRGTRSASCPNPSSASGSMGWWPRSPTRTARSSTSTRRRTARTSTTRRSSMPT